MKNREKKRPPKFARQFLNWFCRRDLLENIQGDLDETFEDHLSKYSFSKARRLYTWEVIGLFRPGIVRQFRFLENTSISSAMFKNYLKIAVRQILKYKLFSGLNIAGLALSMSVCLLLIMILVDQYSYDLFHKKRDRICRIISDRQWQEPANRARLSTAPLPLVEEFSERYPWIEKTLRVAGVGGTFKTDEKTVSFGGALADTSFFEVFSFDWSRGNQHTALSNPNSIVLTEKMAQAIFGNEDPLGRTIEFIDHGILTITGLMPDPPQRSHLKFDFLLSFSTADILDEKRKAIYQLYDWETGHSGHVYLLLDDPRHQKELDRALAQIATGRSKRHPNFNYYLESQALTAISPGPDLQNGIGGATPYFVMYFLIVLGIAVIFSAAFNYTNLSIARALKRAQEIGIRKVNGAKRRQIIFQFLCEAVLISILALFIAIFILEFLIAHFYGLDPFVSQHFHLPRTPFIYLAFLGFSILVGVVAGLFPALHISAFQPVQVLKKLENTKMFTKISLRKALIVFQFTFSLLFILVTIIVVQQQQHVMKMDLGLQTENIINVHLDEIDYNLFAQRTSQIEQVSMVSGSSNILAQGWTPHTLAHFNDQTDSVYMGSCFVTRNFMDNLEIELIAGQNFPENTSTKREQFILIDQTIAAKMGEHPYQAIGQSLQIDTLLLTVIGVFKPVTANNVFFESAGYFSFRYAPDRISVANVAVTGKDIPATIEKMQTAWQDLNPKHPLNYEFYDEQVYQMSKFFTMASRITGFVSFLAIVIACLGLLGMVTYAVEGRIREIGIRKILGASEANLLWKFSKGFFFLLGVASLIALPTCWFLSNMWLQQFANRISVGIPIFSVAVGLIFLLGSLTVIPQIFSAVKANPVDMIKTE